MNARLVYYILSSLQQPLVSINTWQSALPHNNRQLRWNKQMEMCSTISTILCSTISFVVCVNVYIIHMHVCSFVGENAHDSLSVVDFKILYGIG